MRDKPKRKPKKKAKPGPKEERLVITKDPEEALRDFLKQKPAKKRKR
jgi:hypothetical protein